MMKFKEFSLEYMGSISNVLETVSIEYPEQIALEYNNTTITYKEYNNIATKIANFILKYDINKSNITIVSDRNIKVPLVMLGILRSGNYYSIIDNIFPLKRKELFIKIGDPKLVLFIDSCDELMSKFLDINNVILSTIDNCFKVNFPFRIAITISPFLGFNDLSIISKSPL